MATTIFDCTHRDDPATHVRLLAVQVGDSEADTRIRYSVQKGAETVLEHAGLDEAVLRFVRETGGPSSAVARQCLQQTRQAIEQEAK